MMRRMCFLFASLTAVTASVAGGEVLRLTYSDPVGDNEGLAPDVVGLVLNFDNGSGEFQINVTSDDAFPFAPTTPPIKLGIYVNLFNADIGVSTQDPSFFSSIIDFQLTAATTSLTITGTSASRFMESRRPCSN